MMLCAGERLFAPLLEENHGSRDQDRVVPPHRPQVEGCVMPGVNSLTGRPGPAPNPPRSGDKKQARQRINLEVKNGRRPHPNALPCVDCGHLWRPGERRHEYHHHKGYAAEHHYDVEAVCTRCHARRDHGEITHCIRGHAYTPENTVRKSNGTRSCRECRRMRDRARHDAAFWRTRRAKKEGKASG